MGDGKLISRSDFVFTIGYEGNIAVVDGALKRRCASLSSEELAEKGLYKQALCAALYERYKKPGRGEEAAAAGLKRVLEIYNRDCRKPLASVEELMRIFGVFELPEAVAKVMVI